MSKQKKSHVTGTLKLHSRGFGFLIPDRKDLYPEDIFIPKHATEGAVDGDIVEARIFPSSFSGKGPEGHISKILKRSRSHVTGVITRAMTKKGGYAYVPLLGIGGEIWVEGAKAKEGDRVLIEILHWGSKEKDPAGKVIEVIGHILDPSSDVEAAISEYGLDAQFDKEVIAEAKKFGSDVSKADIIGREDLRKLETFTIDPKTAEDFDDALSLSKNRKGYELAVHIADVSHYVQPGTLLDQEAYKRCNSTYFPGKVLPMLPHELSSHLCSLKPHVDRLAITLFMSFDKKGDLKDYRIARSVINSNARFTYEEAKEILDKKRRSPYRKSLMLMAEFCLLLKKKRAERGSIEFALPDVSIQVDKKGRPTHIQIVEYDITHQLVEEFMLKANEVVATHLSELGRPLTYRVHEEPAEENLREFAATASALGFKISTNPTTEELQELFDEVRASPYGKFLATSFIRSMKLASYSTQNIGHYGLGLEHYTHFTSPIRRYIDLIVHRLLFDEVDPAEDLEAIALLCSDKERLSSKVENGVVNLKKLRYLTHLVSKDPDHPFEAVITRIKPFGFFFEVVECLFEGFISIADLGREMFVFDDKLRQIKGNRSKKKFETGTHIHVCLEDVDLIKLETRWRLV